MVCLKLNKYTFKYRVNVGSSDIMEFKKPFLTRA